MYAVVQGELTKDVSLSEINPTLCELVSLMDHFELNFPLCSAEDQKVLEGWGRNLEKEDLQSKRSLQEQGKMRLRAHVCPSVRYQNACHSFCNYL